MTTLTGLLLVTKVGQHFGALVSHDQGALALRTAPVALQSQSTFTIIPETPDPKLIGKQPTHCGTIAPATAAPQAADHPSGS